MKFSEYINQLSADPNLPAWVRKVDEVAALLTVRRYGRRMESARPRYAATWYAKYLQSPHWTRFRIAVMVLSGGKCCRCGDVADHVHHLHYKSIGQEALCDVEPLCEACHTKEHQECKA